MNENRAIWLLAMGAVVIHVLANGQYGFHRDELDMIMNARQLDWGYVAYPPVTPLLARIGLTLFDTSLQGLRLFSAMGQGIVVLLVSAMVHDLGGNRRAQILGAVAVVISPIALIAGTMIQYMAFDYVWWVLLSFCVVRLLRTDDPRWWLAIGLTIGLGMMTKYTIVFLVAGLVISVLLTDLRRALRSRWLWAGVALSLLVFLPNLIWQVQHEFISLRFLTAINQRDIAWGRTETFLVDQLYVANNPLILPLWVAGLGYLLFHPQGRRFRALALTFLATFLLLWIAQGRGYYVSPAYAMLTAAGAVWWEGWLAARLGPLRRWGWRISWGVLTLAGVVGVILAKPIAPINSWLWSITSEVNSEVVEMVGWPDLVEQIAAIYATIPADEKPRTVVLAGNYGEAGALDLYREIYDVPPVISGSNSLWARGYGDEEPQTVILVGFEQDYADRLFRACEQVGQVSNRYGVENEESTRHTSLFVCRQPRQS
jgi:4-amino-4-deoxy-L-arabinose transferase-like glycosyltransferase